MAKIQLLLSIFVVSNVYSMVIDSSILGKPKVTLKLNSSETLKENGVATLLCHVDANAGESADLQYRWFHNGKELIGTNSATLTLPNLNRSVHHKSFYECKVSNDAGEGVSKYEMEILCKGKCFSFFFTGRFMLSFIGFYSRALF